MFNNVSYLNRNFRIDPTISPTVPVPVRLFFLESEVNNLRTADNSLENYARLKATKYSGPAENLTPDDNELVSSNFKSNSNPVLAPYHNGYYAEFQINEFSEFYLAGYPLFDDDAPLPLIFRQFDAIPVSEFAKLSWRFSGTENVENLELQKSLDGENYITAIKLGSPKAEYDYQHRIAQEGNKMYFRLSWRDKVGKVYFSPVKKVAWKPDAQMVVYPNPMQSLAQIYLSNFSGIKEFILVDPLGKSIYKKVDFEEGKAQLELSGLPSGIYLLKDLSGENQSMKLVLK